MNNPQSSNHRLLEHKEVKENQRDENNAVPSEDLEVVFFDILHQEFDNDD